jgi:hypothetical protein
MKTIPFVRMSSFVVFILSLSNAQALNYSLSPDGGAWIEGGLYNGPGLQDPIADPSPSALPSPQPPATEMVPIVRTKSYERTEAAIPWGRTLNDTIFSDGFGVLLTPFNVSATIDSATFDDSGRLGGIPSGGDPACPHKNCYERDPNEICNKPISGQQLQIWGNYLAVNVVAQDDELCHINVGYKATITWKVQTTTSSGGSL